MGEVAGCHTQASNSSLHSRARQLGRLRANNHSIAYCSRGWHWRTHSSTGLYCCSKWSIRFSTKGSLRRFLNRLKSFKINHYRLSRLLTWPDSLLIHLGIGDSSISTKRVPRSIGMYRALSHSAPTQGLGSPYLELPHEAPRGVLYGDTAGVFLFISI
ncbi:hypothetical protein HYPSUDRAFT_654500 [Hypholoma sublateritium FD-334 SS-4]|uniref:Uncharacterized protein n=1 Tax=Hypholoma sublateritium (strain FD-334 SS-4) TaxID=945553 RepID=A0A0D2MG40_HYPSF|nr:hypothetical protein HYPSUDRAFT_654500 [Hypholoma sublateritium FD-334 SS-4]